MACASPVGLELQPPDSRGSARNGLWGGEVHSVHLHYLMVKTCNRNDLFFAQEDG